jgi:hypothetical protein
MLSVCLQSIYPGLLLFLTSPSNVAFLLFRECRDRVLLLRLYFILVTRAYLY